MFESREAALVETLSSARQPFIQLNPSLLNGAHLLVTRGHLRDHTGCSDADDRPCAPLTSLSEAAVTAGSHYGHGDKCATSSFFFF